MLRSLKRALYFTVASYFTFFARIALSRWKPRIVVVTGSNGKTTALNLIEVQLGDRARYSHGANSSFGIPFDILGLKRKSYSVWEWPLFALLAPFRAWATPYAEKIYVVEADCDRPYEGDFLSKLLKPEVTVWLSAARTHSMNFSGDVDKNIAHEFGYFLERTQKLAIVNDNPLIQKELSRTKAGVRTISAGALQSYAVSLAGTEYSIGATTYRLPYLLPKEVFYSIAASVEVARYFGLTPTNDLSAFAMPPGRSSLFKGMKDTTLLDSSYNANASSVAAVLDMVKKVSAPVKWLVLGDLIEQGAQTKEEHAKVARMVAAMDFKKIILVGPRMKQHALPILPNAVAFEQPKDALDYIQKNITGNELIIFKGARFLEGIIEALLADKRDVTKLCRRESVWQKRRAAWGL